MPEVLRQRPLPKRHRRYTFLFLLFIFLFSIPFLILYATGYRFDFTKQRANFVSTGGIFIGAERTGAEIYIDDELVRETRVFRRAFYAQNLDPGTHRVHVQREGSHTWVKELPVYPHLVTEAQAFNLPLFPQARVIGQYQTATGALVVPAAYQMRASTTQEIFVASTTATSTYTANQEYVSKKAAFVIEEPQAGVSAAARALANLTHPGATTTTATSSEAVATTTKERAGVRLFQSGDDVYAEYVGPRESMPYYYCAEPFAPLSTSTDATDTPPTVGKLGASAVSAAENPETLDAPVQQVLPGTPCVPQIRIDRKWQKVKYFDFFPGSTDLVMMVLEHGVYAVEIDDRAWQNVQPMMEGDDLDARIIDGRAYVYDKKFIYELLFE